MADFKLKCPFCGQMLEADEEWRGERAECPNCHRQFDIPSCPPVEESPEPSQASDQISEEGGGGSEKKTKRKKSAPPSWLDWCMFPVGIAMYLIYVLLRFLFTQVGLAIVGAVVVIWGAVLMVKGCGSSEAGRTVLDSDTVWKAESSGGCSRRSDEPSSGSGCSRRPEPPPRERPPEMSASARIGKAWVERNLPPSQRRLLETGVGGPGDKENLMANLIESGCMDEVIAYMEYLNAYHEWLERQK